jgi:hypothetical protein
VKSERGVFAVGIPFIALVMIFSCSLGRAEAAPRGGAVQGPRGGTAVQGPRGGTAVEGPRGGMAVEGPRGNVAVGTRYDILPPSARIVAVGNQTYYLDDSGVYYLPCEDDDTVFCVIPAPQ